MKLALPASVSSLQDVTSLLLEIKEYSRWFAHESIKKRVNATHASEPPAMSKAAEDLLRAANAKASLTRADIDQLITMLDHYRTTAPTLTITLAAPPTASVKATLVNWCRENIAPHILVNFQFNSPLLGGMVVRSGSRVFDWSFRRQLLEAKDKFPEVLRHV